jgi:hypothetical protein
MPTPPQPIKWVLLTKTRKKGKKEKRVKYKRGGKKEHHIIRAYKKKSKFSHFNYIDLLV